MIEFVTFTLDNGLRVLVNTDRSTPFVVLNTLYDVGSKDEQADKTGFAHLFEHLMFGGSANIPSFDEPLQRVGGENNAFTSTDITNYYTTVPEQNIETAFWLESDRMLKLDFSQRSLDVQRNVVCEEFRQRYLNKPYGDVWLLLRPMVFKQHPYSWPTIGKDISHIEQATLADVEAFFYSHYAPNNAILTISGNLEADDARELCEKWFGAIPRRVLAERILPSEPTQTEQRFMQVERPVPFDALYKAFRICKQTDEQYRAVDLLSDLLANGKSSRLYLSLVKEKKMFSEINAHVSGEIEEGMLVVSGNLMKGVSLEEADAAVSAVIEQLRNDLVTDYELKKVQNKVESSIMFSETNILNKAMSLARYQLLGDPNLINTEANLYHAVTAEQIRAAAQQYLQVNNSSTLYYKAKA